MLDLPALDLDELEEDLVAIDSLPSHVWYQDMADFAEQIGDDRAARGLARAIQGRGEGQRTLASAWFPQMLPQSSGGAAWRPPTPHG